MNQYIGMKLCKKRFFIALSLSFLIFLIIYCSMINEGNAQELVYGESSPPVSLDPNKVESMPEKRLCQLLFSTLITETMQGVFASNAADEKKLFSESSSGALIMDIHLKAGLKWAGLPDSILDVDDVISTLNTLSNPSGTKAREIPIEHVFPRGRLNLVPGGSQLHISIYRESASSQNEQKMKKLFSNIHITPALFRFPQDWVEWPTGNKNKGIVPGSGPYILDLSKKTDSDSHLSQIRFTLVANPNYDPPPQIKRISILVGTITEMAGYFTQGALHVIPEVNPNDMQPIIANTTMKFAAPFYNSLSFLYFGFNCRAGRPYSDLLRSSKFRKFMNEVYKTPERKKQIIRLFGGYGTPLDGPFDYQSPGYIANNNPMKQPENQQQWIEDCKEKFSNICREYKLTPPLKLYLIYPSGTLYDDQYKQLYNGLANEMAQYEMKIESLGIPPDQWKSKVRGNDYDIILSRFSYRMDFDLSDFAAPYGRENYIGFVGDQNDNRYVEFQRNLNAAKTINIPEGREKKLTEIYTYLRDNYPGIFIFTPQVVSLINTSKVSYKSIHPYLFFNEIEKWGIK